MSCSSGSCTCGFVYKNKVRNSQASPSPPAPPYYPLTGQRSATGGGNVCVWWVGGQVVVRKMEGGNIAPPGPRRRKRQLEQLAREPLACIWFFLFSSTTPSPNPFLPPPNPYPIRPLPPSRCSSAWPGAPGSPQAVTGVGEGERQRDERDGVPQCNGVQGVLGEPKNGLLYFWPIAAVGGVWGGDVPHPLPLPPPRSPPPLSVPPQLGAAGRAAVRPQPPLCGSPWGHRSLGKRSGKCYIISRGGGRDLPPEVNEPSLKSGPARGVSGQPRRLRH